MGHLGFEWQHSQYDLSFDANLPFGDLHQFSFNSSARRTDLDVRSLVIEPFQFGVQTRILDYDQIIHALIVLSLPSGLDFFEQ